MESVAFIRPENSFFKGRHLPSKVFKARLPESFDFFPAECTWTSMLITFRDHWKEDGRKKKKIGGKKFSEKIRANELEYFFIIFKYKIMHVVFFWSKFETLKWIVVLLKSDMKSTGPWSWLLYFRPLFEVKNGVASWVSRDFFFFPSM
jgi:hypothetical protein